ncbi:MAG: hypothetical protein CL868_17070 [Cytophagaceae bacterium]|nr:hypothetical protein [Cytophagaceae bacterium]|tara:strand:+ start:12706 stop:13194 length:489 start_codon:yes stop_codon:yes gene_type:complete
MNIFKNLFILILLFSASNIAAQSIERHTFSSGGGELASSSTTLSFTIGEPIVGNISSGGPILGQGFWAGAAAGETLDVNTLKKDLNGIAVFPNPVKDVLFLKFQGINNLSAQVIDINGRTLLRKDLNDNQDQLDLSNLSSGYYFIRVNAEQGTQKTFKIIKN